jgi:hypothetical protein
MSLSTLTDLDLPTASSLQPPAFTPLNSNTFLFGTLIIAGDGGHIIIAYDRHVAAALCGDLRLRNLRLSENPVKPLRAA